MWEPEEIDASDSFKCSGTFTNRGRTQVNGNADIGNLVSPGTFVALRGVVVTVNGEVDVGGSFLAKSSASASFTGPKTLFRHSSVFEALGDVSFGGSNDINIRGKFNVDGALTASKTCQLAFSSKQAQVRGPFNNDAVLNIESGELLTLGQFYSRGDIFMSRGVALFCALKMVCQTFGH